MFRVPDRQPDDAGSTAVAAASRDMQRPVCVRPRQLLMDVVERLARDNTAT
jgi:hypothetical protein